MPANCVKSVKIRPINGDNKKIKKNQTFIRAKSHLSLLAEVQRRTIRLYGANVFSRTGNGLFKKSKLFDVVVCSLTDLEGHHRSPWGLPTVEDNAAVKIGFK